MKLLLDHKQMQQCDINTMEHFGVISPVLMERAALCVTEEIVRQRGDSTGKVLIACGTGNNGGDGLAAARMLFQKDIPVDIWYPGNEEKASPEGKRQLDIVRRYGIPLYQNEPDGKYDIVVDALFGIGLSREVGGVYRDVIESLNAMQAKKLAVDICSGIHTDTGQVMGIAFVADLTVTFGFQKLGHVLFPGAEYAGEVISRDMGIDRFSLLDMEIPTFYLEEEDLYPLAERSTRTNKGSYGKLLLIAGSRNMAGAAVLAAQGAYAAGAGLVRAVTPSCNREIIQKTVPEAVLTTYEDDAPVFLAESPAGENDFDWLREALEWADAVVVGPGLGKSRDAQRILDFVLSENQKPILLDADALNLLAENGRDLSLPENCVITPHPGEMQRLSGISVKDQQKEMIKVALDFAKGYNTVIVLKDAHTVIASPDGRVCVNLTGNAGMATGGSGDVLSGVTGYLLATGRSAFEAACLGVYLHGAAGDVAAGTKGMAGMTAADLPDAVGEVLRRAEHKC